MSLRIPRACALSVLTLAAPAAAGTLYVDANLTTGANDGSSWADAFQGESGLAVALTMTMPGDEVFVAAGRYIPTTTGMRQLSFPLQTGVEIYGGFAGGEASPAERPPFGTAVSVLSADLNGDDGSSMIADNSFHVIRAPGTDATAVLDGFEVSGGNANGTGNNDRGGGILCRNGADPTVRNCRFVDNRCTFGGGAGYINNAEPNFTACTFEDNFGGAFGGAFDIASTSNVRFDRCSFINNMAARGGGVEIFASNELTITNCLFLGNTATGNNGGGALWVGQNSECYVVNSTVVGNVATNQATGGLRLQGSIPLVFNCIFWDNEGPGGAQGSVNQITIGTPVSYSLVEGGFVGTGNLASDPQFVNPLGGDYSLSLSSPAIDAADNSQVPVGIVSDFDGNTRFFDEPSVADTGAGAAPLTDMGAFEFQGVLTASYCIAAPNSVSPGATMGSIGRTSVSANLFSLTTSGALPGGSGLYFYGPNAIQAPFGDGFRCVGGATFRLQPPVAANGIGEVTRALDTTASPAVSGAGAITPGATWNFQLWYRDPMGPGGNGFNLSNGLEVTFVN